MVTNRCEFIDPIARTQCNQEAYADFTGDRQRLCKLHTFIFVNRIDNVDHFNGVGPVNVFNESDAQDLKTLLESKMRDLDHDAPPEVPEPVVEDKEENKPEPEQEHHEDDINRSDKDQNEVK